ncbi:1,5-anhydro-D-fructose reductase [Thalassovita gelatinovora]|uniref:1,5-anhydro-D-fructose reductase n=1 Tax=Thalassovita gelatinovora TaxID=53501 RepID=A0A0P1F9G0_THAGE|nr:NAD-dependent epimerase/dehydratase family protein [Thalassovita gelatinovora]QIZ81177.1 NAD-dependent epimerase/dehydratase family protein [Thalassovita gelatinovora]CUH64771.1 1,5-anhydro-D-fructose reductase [Thalassovita gelatinovora]SEP92375.1 Predicted dehydrogenase [Thalassovita gelatinovora]
MTNPPIRVGIIGAGYIASWHADAIRAAKDAELACICDVSLTTAQDMANGYGVQAFGSVDDMIAAKVCDAVHILTPPDFHKGIALTCFKAGLHCLVEKPVALSAVDTQEMVEAADQNGVRFAAGHNFLSIPAYHRLKAAKEAGKIGRVSAVEINWCFPLAPLRSGPYGIWLLRQAKNLLLELGPHPFAFAVDLFGPLQVSHLELGQPITLPGGAVRHQSWRVIAKAGDVDVSINLSLVETHDERSLTLRGSSGVARMDYAADTLVIAQDNAADLVLNPLLKQLNMAGQHLREGVVNAVRQVVSLNQKSPYGLSFRGAIDAVYGALRAEQPEAPRYTGRAALQVMQAIDDTLAMMPDPVEAIPVSGTPKPTVMVIGGTGFIGRNLTRMLVARGYDVRVLSRGRQGPFDDIADHVETVAVSLKDAAGLRQAMQGIDAVFNLAKSMDKTWDAALENDVGVAVRVAEAALEAGVKRLIYTGTIASFDMSDPSETITDDTDFGDMSDRNLYARSKAECETRLTQMHEDRGLPLVIARPGIVIGEGGPLQHWGIGRWHGAGAVRIWGDGKHILPFVLADDVSDGLIRMMEKDEAIGKSFNLIGDPIYSARGYFNAIQATLGARIKVRSGNLAVFWMADAVKYVLKTKVLRRKDVVRPSLNDWKSRAHFSPFDNRYPKDLLGWQPETNPDRFAERGIVQANLFGL